jgi:ABC-type multidrug transport system fused ATPase/permease subunit
MGAESELVCFDAVALTFPAIAGRGAVEAIRHLDLGIKAGEFVAIIVNPTGFPGGKFV